MRCLLASLCLCWFVSSAQAQSANPPSPQSGSKGLQHRTQEMVDQQRKQDRRIDLIVNASGANGKPVTGLQQEDFTILDENQPQKIVSFQAVEGSHSQAQVEIVLVLDLINTTFQRIAFERQQIDKFLLEHDGKLAHPVRVAIVTDTGIQLQPQATQDGKAIAAALDNAHTGLRAIGRSAGAEGAVERLQMSLKYFGQLAGYESSVPGRKMLLWVSPGWPLLESTIFSTSPGQQQKLYQSVVGITNDLRRSHITLYSIDPLDIEEGLERQYYYRSFLEPPGDVRKATPGNLGVQVLAIHSGGLVFPASNELASRIESCITDADSFYVLSFDPAPSDKPNEFHAVTVKVSKPEVKVRTTVGYYSEP